ncbi:MAG: heme NO-binding domain-containing protein [Bacteroidia bacterium]|nr:heme NO-binding domain-containing protein [Bacteroidia bacterium]
MKGIVFTELLEMVEDKFGFELADQVITETDLPSKGIYTAVGTYEFSELVAILVKLNELTGVSIGDLQRVYGNHLFTRFSQLYSHFFADAKDAFSFLSKIEDYIHVEVRKLYPDAELPSFDIKQLNPSTLEMNYSSERGMADFAHGLIEGCLNHFGEEMKVDRIDLNEQKTKSQFTLTRVLSDVK